MIIKRIVDGNEINIELTARELSDAFYEQEHLFDIEDVLNKLNEMSDDDFADYGLTREQVEKEVDEIAYIKRHSINKYDMNWEEAVRDAIDTYLYDNAIDEDDE